MVAAAAQCPDIRSRVDGGTRRAANGAVVVVVVVSRDHRDRDVRGGAASVLREAVFARGAYIIDE